MITNINIGICQNRLKQNKPCYFVNYLNDGKQNYVFFSMRFSCEDFKNRLLKISKIQTL